VALGCRGVAFGCEALALGKAMPLLRETLALWRETLALWRETLALRRESLAWRRETLALLSEALILRWEALSRGGEALARGETRVGGETLIGGAAGLRRGGRGITRPRLLRRRETRLPETLRGRRCGGCEPTLRLIEGAQLSGILLRVRRIRLPQNRRIRRRYVLLPGIACRLRLITLRARLIRRVPRCRHGGERTTAAR
jgi:hypothetical protein